jgi:hypothetical protein
VQLSTQLCNTSGGSFFLFVCSKILLEYALLTARTYRPTGPLGSSTTQADYAELTATQVGVEVPDQADQADQAAVVSALTAVGPRAESRN